MPTDENTLLANFPAEVEVSAEPISQLVDQSGRILVVLDDDPTGTQSVADLPVLTRWEVSDFTWALAQGKPAVYVMTNSRSLAPAVAEERNREVVGNALVAGAALGINVGFVSRSDSTLRGHYPLETDVIAETLAAATDSHIDGVVIVPAFPDAGRVTIGSIHYMRTPEGLVPVAETEFANDASFGFTHSDLRDYVEEKSAGRYAAADVIAIDLNIVRAGADAVADALSAATNSAPIVVDIVTENDLRLLALGLAAAEARGKTFLYRVGPPFVRARIGQDKREPLTIDELSGVVNTNAVGGLIVVGSHVGLTTRQLTQLTEGHPLAATCELNVDLLRGPDGDAHVREVAERAVDALHRGDVVIHTSRTLIKTDDPDVSLDISRRVSAAVVEAVQQVLAAYPPRFVIAKGGITSSDVASEGLSIRHATVEGPMLPGIVSLWQPVDGPATGIPYVVFAGNVGGDDSLLAVVKRFDATR